MNLMTMTLILWSMKYPLIIKIFFGAIAGYAIAKVFIKLYEILTFKKDKPNPMAPIPVETTFIFKYALIGGIAIMFIIFIMMPFTTYIAIPITKSFINLIQSLF